MANFNVSYLIELKDKYTASAEKIARMNKRMQASFRLMRMKLNKASKDLEAFGKKAKTIGRDMMFSLSLPVAGAFTYMIKKAGDATETFSKFDVVFSGLGDSAENSAKRLMNSFDLSELKAKTLLSTTGDILKGFGFTGKQALKLSDQVNSLALDMASFKNVSQERASEALTKALLGEREMLKMLGTAITEDIVKQELATMGMAKLTGTALRQAKALATLRITMRMNKDAVGDYQRTKDSFNNSLKRFGNLVEQISVSLGSMLLPYANKLLIVFGKALKTFDALNPALKQMVLFWGAMAIVIPPIVFAVGMMATAIGAVGIVTAGWIAGGIALAGVLSVVYTKSETFRMVLGMIWSALKALTLVIAVIGKGLWNYLIKYIVMAVVWFTKWLTPIGWVLQGLNAIIKALGGVKAIASTLTGFFDKVSGASMNILTGKKGEVVQSKDVTNKTTVDGNITVSAEKGSKVTKTSMQTKGSNANLGLNRATAGKR